MSILKKKIIIEGEIHALSGIMIGSSGSAMSIGGPDKQVIRNPVTKLPYIPGSSLKGKMRSLIELRDGTIGKNNGPTLDPNALAAQLFGYIKEKRGDNKENERMQPSRLIVRDGELINQDAFNNTDLLFTEAKTENAIDRITASANPRTFERVPKGAVFHLSMVLNIFKDDPLGDKFLDTIYNAFDLIEDDYIGGGGSRGNGQVKFYITKILEKSAEDYKLAIKDDENNKKEGEAITPPERFKKMLDENVEV